MDKKIIVSLTSWPKRICNVLAVIESLLNQDIEPDIIQINLSEDEFKNKEFDLPNDLQLFIKDNQKIHIEWVKGNDGVFKKIIPTLKKHYGENYYLLSVDDDWIYRHDYIKMMIEFIEKFSSDSFCLSQSLVIGNRMIYKSAAFEPDFWEKLTQDAILARIDDSYIEYYLKCKKRKMSCYRPSDTQDITKKFNPIFPNSNNTITGNYSKKDIDSAKLAIQKINFY